MDRITPERMEKSQIIDVINWIDRIKFMGRQVFEAELEASDSPAMNVFLSERHMRFINNANALQADAVEMVQRIRILKIQGKDGINTSKDKCKT